MCTTVPSGIVMSAGPAVKLTCCWPQARTPPNRRIPPTRAAAFNESLKLLVRMGSLVVFVSVGLVDHKFPGINQHHHQHSTGENIVGGDLALVVRVPHKRKTSFARGGVRDRARRWRCAGGPGRTDGGIRTEIGASTVPRTVREDVRIGQSCGAAARDIAEWSRLNWLVVILTPLVIVERSGGPGVVAVGIRITGKLGQGISGSGIVTVCIPVQTFGCPVENSVEGLTRSRRGGEQQRSGKTICIGLAENQVPVAPQDTHVVTVLVERMLPPALADDA